MKQMNVRAIIMMIIAALFLFGVIFFCFEYVTDGADWGLYPANTHIFKTDKSTVQAKLPTVRVLCLSKQ